jgi:hypothetical protein
MKLSALATGVFLASALTGAAQVSVEVTLEQDQFLPAEAIVAAVKITNRSGQTLQFGTDPDWLTFSIESGQGSVALKTSEPPVAGEFTLESAKIATRRVDLAPYFTLSKMGRYRIIATVRVKAWNQLITSAPKAFDIIQGAKLWSQEFGVPEGTNAVNGTPEARKYTLQQANYLRTQPRLYFKLTDATETRVFKVFPIGNVVSFSHPETQLDKWSNLHLLWQDGARSFSYTVITPDGDLTVRQTYDTAETRPRLSLNQDNKMIVAGGTRRVTANDIPLPTSAKDDAKPPKL